MFRNGLLGLIMALSLLAASVRAEEYLTKNEFLAGAFPKSQFESIPESKVIWPNAQQKAVAAAILGHPLRQLRLRYWSEANVSAWVLEEIGKEKPITIGVVIRDAAIDDLKILAFRESRGWEVRHDFFTKQFKGVTQTAQHRLSESIDGITGATLSVRAVKAVAGLALYFDGQVASQ